MGKTGLGKSDLGGFRVQVMGKLCPQRCWHSPTGINKVDLKLGRLLKEPKVCLESDVCPKNFSFCLCVRLFFLFCYVVSWASQEEMHVIFLSDEMC